MFRQTVADQPVNPKVASLIAATISLLIHAAVGLSIYNQPLGHVDLNLLEETKFVPVRRATEDLIHSSERFSDDARQPSLQPPSISDLGQTLLSEWAPALKSHPVSLNPVRAHLLVFDERPDRDETLSTTIPSFRLPDLVLEESSGRPQLSIAITHDDTVTAPEPQSADIPQSEDLLNQIGIDLSRQPPPPRLKPPALIESGPVADRRLIDKLSETPPIDFARIALAGTMRLRIPEELDHDFDYRLTSYQEPHQRRTGGGYFQADLSARRSLKRLRSMAKDVVFVIDTSASVPQSWVKATVSGVSDAMTNLNPGDRFNVVLFNEQPSFFSVDQIQPFNARTLEAAQAFLRGARSGGMTDVNNALSRLLVRGLQSDRVYYLILISDGRPTRGVMNTRELINLITRDNDLSASIYCIGIGPRYDRQLLEFLAYRNRGICLFVSKRQDTAQTIRDLIGRLRFSILKDIHLQITGLNNHEVFPLHLPNIHQGETFSIFGRFEFAGEFTLRLLGFNGAQQYDVTFTSDLRTVERGRGVIATQWARRKLVHLYSQLLRDGESEALSQQIDQLHDRFRIRKAK